MNRLSRILVIGVGNRCRADDGAGIKAAVRLKKKKSAGFEVVSTRPDAASLIETWTGADAVFLIDAACAKEPAGTVFRINVHKDPLPRTLSLSSSHALGVAEAVEMARTLDRLPPHFVIYTVVGKNFSTGSRLSRAVAKGVERIVEEVITECNQVQHENPTS